MSCWFAVATSPCQKALKGTTKTDAQQFQGDHHWLANGYKQAQIPITYYHLMQIRCYSRGFAPFRPYCILYQTDFWLRDQNVHTYWGRSLAKSIIVKVRHHAARPLSNSEIIELAFDFICCCPHMKEAEGLYETRIQPKVRSRIEVNFRNSQLAD